MLSVPANLGYGALFLLVLAESAGVPVPGETALLAAGALAGAGKLSLPVVVAVAASAAILGDSIGFWSGRRGGRKVLVARGPFAGHRKRLLARGERFFARHGPKTVFLARWVTGVRVVAAVVAGASAMPWRTFALYNVLGALFWAATTATIAALVGPVGIAVLYGGGIAALALIAGSGALRSRRRARQSAYADN